MKEKRKRGFDPRQENLMGALVGIILIGSVAAFITQSGAVLACFGLPGAVLVIALVVIMAVPGSRERQKED